MTGRSSTSCGRQLAPGRKALEDAQAAWVIARAAPDRVVREILDKIKCASYLVSTSGARFRHPHSRAIELLLEHHRHRVAPCLYFNYLTETTEPWRDGGKASGLKFTTVHPKGVSIQV